MKWFVSQAELLRQQGLSARFKAFVKKVARPVVKRSYNFISARPALHHRLVMLAIRLGLYSALRSIYLPPSVQHISTPQITTHSNTSAELSVKRLTPRARNVYNDLKAGIATQYKDAS
ncbi:MAG: hypothetical protein WBP02_20305 [Gammaproteobacteria bacterium]